MPVGTGVYSDSGIWALVPLERSGTCSSPEALQETEDSPPPTPAVPCAQRALPEGDTGAVPVLHQQGNFIFWANDPSFP